MTDSNILRGWKEIESYLRLTRKAIRACGYPVRREFGKRRKVWSVYALKSELDAFMRRMAARD